MKKNKLNVRELVNQYQANCDRIREMADTCEKHAIIEWNCVGCGRCIDACQHGCAEMRPGGIYRTRK